MKPGIKTNTRPPRPGIKKDYAEIARRQAEIEANRKVARWIFALAWCGLTVREIAHVLNIRDLSLVRQPLYGHGWLMYDRITPPKVLPDSFRELWDDLSQAPNGLRELLEKRDARDGK